MYRLGTVNSNTVNSKFHLIRIIYEVSVNIFSIILCLKCTVNSNFHLIQSKSLQTNDFELTVPDLYIHKTMRNLCCNFIPVFFVNCHYWQHCHFLTYNLGTILLFLSVILGF